MPKLQLFAPRPRFAVAPAIAPDMPAVDPAEPVERDLPEYGVIVVAVEGEQTADLRIVDAGALTWREPPMSLTVCHDPNRVGGLLEHFGRIDAAGLAQLSVDLEASADAAAFTAAYYAAVGDTGAVVVALAQFDLGCDQTGACVNPMAEGRELARMVAGGFLTGVSMEVGNEQLSWECIEVVTDEDGFEYCDNYLMHLEAGEIGAVTITPFQAIDSARVIGVDTDIAEVDGAEPDQAETVTAAVQALTWWPSFDSGDPDAQPPAPRTVRRSVTASAMLMTGWAPPATPPAERFSIPEPTPGGMIELEGGPVPADEFLIPQNDSGALAVPLQVTAAGEVFGHGGFWSQCHVGYRGECVSPPPSEANYEHFHVGSTVTASGEVLATGTLTIGTDHAAHNLRAGAARDHYANTGLGWAAVRATNGIYGPWFSGSVFADVTEEQLQVIRASAMSGDWRRIGRGLEMIGLLSVNTPGFPIVREVMVADGRILHVAATPRPGAWVEAGVQQTLVASAIVRGRHAAGDCGCGGTSHELEDRVHALESIIAAAGLAEVAAAALTASLEP